MLFMFTRLQHTLQMYMVGSMSNKSKNLGFSTNILDNRSKIQDFQLIIQDFQEELGLSIDNPRFSICD